MRRRTTALLRQPDPDLAQLIRHGGHAGADSQLAAVAEFQGGHDVDDGNVGGQHVFFNDSKAAVEGTDPIVVAHQAIGNFGAAGIMKAGFGKIRNVSLTYDVPGNWVGSLGAAAAASVTLTGAQPRDDLASTIAEVRRARGRTRRSVSTRRTSMVIRTCRTDTRRNPGRSSADSWPPSGLTY